MIDRLEQDRRELVAAARKMQPDVVRRLPDSFKLDFPIDVRSLAGETDGLTVTEWSGQKTFTAGMVVGSPNDEWRVLSLRSVAGDAERTDPGGAEMARFDWTRHAERFPGTRAFLTALPIDLQAVRLMALVPGGRSPEHVDSCVGLCWGKVRLHVPLRTSTSSYVVFEGRRVHWDDGLWFGSFSLPHYVENRGSETRTHLVIDGTLRPGFLDLLPRSVREVLRPDDVLIPEPFVPAKPGTAPLAPCEFEMPEPFLNLAAPAEEFVRTTKVAWARIDPISSSSLALIVDGRPSHILMRTGPDAYQILGWPHKSMAFGQSPFGIGVRLSARVGPLSYSRVVQAKKLA